MAFFQVTSSELRNRASRLQELNGQFKAKASELQGKRNFPVQYVGGEAKTVFHQAFMNDRQQMDVFYGLIAQYVQALLEIAARYEEAEARNREIAAARRY